MAMPSGYAAEHCDDLIEHMSAGLSFASFAGKLRVARQTLYNWEKAHPEFKEAHEIGLAACLLFWEQTGIEGLWNVTEYDGGKPSYSKTLNATVWIFNMKNRFQWRDRTPDEVKEEAKARGPSIQLTDAQLEKLKVKARGKK